MQNTVHFLEYALAGAVGFAICFAIGFIRRRKQAPPGETIIQSASMTTMGTAWRPPK